jgi:hypothetical protein
MSTWGPPCIANERTTIKLFGSNKTWDKKGVLAMKYAELLARNTKYGAFVARLGSRNAATVQTYACRPITGTTGTYSLHSWPRAVDIRPPENPFSYDGLLKCEYNKFGRRDGLRFVKSFLAAGFRWGATWSHGAGDAKQALRRVGQHISTGRVDAMHFELDQEPQVNRSFWRKRLRKYARQHAIYWAKVKKDAKVKNAAELIDKWEKGQA